MTVSGTGVVTVVKPGDAVITVVKEGGGNYLSQKVEIPVSVSKARQVPLHISGVPTAS